MIGQPQDSGSHTEPGLGFLSGLLFIPHRSGPVLPLFPGKTPNCSTATLEDASLARVSQGSHAFTSTLRLSSCGCTQEIIEPHLPKGSRGLFAFSNGNRSCAALTRLLRLRSFRAARSFSLCSAVKGVPFCDSLISKCACSGITT
jgi:hypothetical protein